MMKSASKSKIDRAIEMATVAHESQVRKGTKIPYIIHPVSVGFLLSQAGCNDDLVVAGILHDTAEDTDITFDEIQEEFGNKIKKIVEGCSEPDKSKSWAKRKQHTIEYLKTATEDIRIVSCADKLHNIRTMTDDYKKDGDEIWKRFKKGKKEQAGYYHGLVNSLCRKHEYKKQSALFEQFAIAVENLFGSPKVQPDTHL